MHTLAGEELCVMTSRPSHVDAFDLSQRGIEPVKSKPQNRQSSPTLDPKQSKLSSSITTNPTLRARGVAIGSAIARVTTRQICGSYRARHRWTRQHEHSAWGARRRRCKCTRIATDWSSMEMEMDAEQLESIPTLDSSISLATDVVYGSALGRHL